MADIKTKNSQPALALICLAGVPALGAFYLFVLFKTRTPDVSLEYQYYYIDQQLRNWPGRNGLTYQLGHEIDFSKQQPFLDQRWPRHESWGLWSSQAEAAMVLRIKGVQEDASLHVVIKGARAFTYDNRDQQIKLIANDKTIGEYTIKRDGPFQLEASLPASEINEKDLLRLQFKFPNCVAPNALKLSNDRRCLAIGLKTMTITLNDKDRD